MLTIQDVGQEILSNKPRSFYVFGGPEYGIKLRYIQLIAKQFSNEIKEYDSLDVLLNTLSTKRIIPLSSCVYVVRYDDAFVSSLSDNTESKISSIDINGCVVCIYENSKQVAKLAKYLPNYTVDIQSVSPQYIFKYLKSDFPNLSDAYVDIVSKICKDYNHGRNMCNCLSTLNTAVHLDKSEIMSIFGLSVQYNSRMIALSIASKNFNQFIKLVDESNDLDGIYYSILSTMIELDKLLDNKYTESDLRPYVKNWTRQDVYYMFMNTYNQLEYTRTYSTFDKYFGLVHLGALLRFKSIPSPEALS